MITCRELLAFMSDYLDGSLPDDERAAFEEHLSVCPDCINYLESYRRTVRLGALSFDHPDDPPPDDVPAGLIEAILAARAGGGGAS